MTQKVYIIENLDCANCAAKIEAKFNALPEVAEAIITFPTRQLRLTAENPDELIGKLTEIARTVEGEVEIRSREVHHHHDHHHEGCSCGHHHDHHADEVFTSWGVETARKFTKEQITQALEALDSGKYGTVLRAKGIVEAQDGTWIHFDHVPQEADVRTGSAAITGKVCVIGAQLNEAEIAALFGV